MFPYEVMSENDALKARYSLLEDGEYSAVVFDCIDKISQNSGNPMFEITLHVIDKQGNKNEIKDFCTFTHKMMWKVIRLCASAGVLASYENKTLTPTLLKGKQVKVLVKVRHGKEIPFDKLNGKPMGSLYPDQNVIEDYLMDTKPSSLQPLTMKPESQFPDDDIPF